MIRLQMITDCIKANNTIKFTMERQIEVNSSKISSFNNKINHFQLTRIAKYLRTFIQ